jgi:hypothetical protein
MRTALATTATILVLLVPGAPMAANTADTTPPSIKITSPVNNTVYAVNQPNVNAHYQCSGSEESADVRSCAGVLSTGASVPNGASIPTSPASARYTLTVTGIDEAGNKASLKVNYSVSCGSCAPPPGPPSPPTLGATPPSADAQGSDVVVDPGTSVACPAGGDLCTTDVTATSGKTVVGRGHFRTRGGKKTKLRFKLTASGARLLRQHRTLRLRFTIASRVGKTKPIRATKTVPIRAP